MILCVNVDNSNITLGGFDGDELTFVATLSANRSLTKDEYIVKFTGILDIYGVDKANIKGAIVSSVVPRLNSAVLDAVKFVFGVTPLTVGPGVKTGINIHCDIPSSVGADIICACVAVHFIYGSPSLIVDMGTATKMIVVNSKGVFVGASIVPGVLMGLDALCSGAAQLSQVELDTPSAVIAKNTSDCIKSGVVFGHASMIDGMIERIKDEVGELSVYATGDYANTVLPYLKHEITFDRYLVLKGLNIIYKKNVK